MLEKLKGLSQKYAEIEYMLSQSEVWADAQKAAALSREKAELAPLMEAYARYETFRQEAESAEELLSDPEMKDLARETLSEARSGMERTAEELKILLLPKDPDDGKNVIVEIRGGVGGEESALFAADLFRMYEMYAERKGFSVEIVNRSETELGGIREIEFLTQTLQVRFRKPGLGWRTIIVTVLTIFSSVGVYVGRFLRLHTAYLFFDPGFVIKELITMWSPRMLAFVFMMFLLQMTVWVSITIGRITITNLDSKYNLQ